MKNLYLYFFEEFILGSLFFVIYKNHVSSNIRHSVKLFVDDTSIFLNVNETVTKLNKDLESISKWAHHWKMSLNRDPRKMTKEVLFSRKKSKVVHINLTFLGKDVNRSQSQKYLSSVLSSKLNSDIHLNEKIFILKYDTALLRKQRYSKPRRQCF